MKKEEKLEKETNPAEEPAKAAPPAEEEEKFVPCMTYPVRMAYEAGFDLLKQWPCEGRTVHAGIGWFHPFGRSEYFAIVGDCPERKEFPLEDYFTEKWMDIFDTGLFCIYRLQDGDIYAYDGIFQQRGTGDEGVPNKTVELRRDILTNVIVGGTGRYKGATGLMIGTAEGSGWSKVCDEETGQTLPQALLKCLEGYIKIPY